MENNNQIHNEEEHASVSLKVILLVFAVVLVGALSYFVWDAQNTVTDTTDYSTPIVTKKAETTGIETKTEDTNNIYNNSLYSFSFSYPKTTSISTDSKHSDNNEIVVRIFNLKTMEDEPFGYDKTSLTGLRDDLISGAVKTAIEGKYAKDTIVLSALEVCNVQFTRYLDIFDGGDLMISIIYKLGKTNKNKIIIEDSTYFVTDNTNCSGEKRWDDSKRYREDLLDNKTGATSQVWIDNFKIILGSFKFN